MLALKEPNLPLEYRLQHQVARPLLQSRVPPILVWRCKHPHGLFSMFSLAMGHADQCEKRGWALIVDWSDEDLLYRGAPGEPNLWTAFFQQPAEVLLQPEALHAALRQGQFMKLSATMQSLVLTEALCRTMAPYHQSWQHMGEHFANAVLL